MKNISKKAQIIASREELNQELLLEKFGFKPKMQIEVLFNPKIQFPLFYLIKSPTGVFFTINSKYIKFKNEKKIGK